MHTRSTLPNAEPRRKENQFIDKRGRKHHNYPPGKAPYPLSYDRDLLDRQSSTLLSLSSFLISLPALLRIIICGETYSMAGQR